MIDIGVRLKEFRIRSNSKMPAIEAATGIAKETLYKWEKGTKPSDINEYFTLNAYLNKMEGKLEVEAFELENKKPATLRLPFNPNRPPILQTDGKAVSGTVIFTDNEPELIVDRIYSPFLGNVEGMIEVTGNSMSPAYPSGSRIAICRLQDIEMLEYGRCYYIIDKNLQGMLKQVYSAGYLGSIKLVSNHPDQNKYPPFYRSYDEILTIFKVVACIIKL